MESWKLGKNGSGQEKYDVTTGKYVDDGIPNKYVPSSELDKETLNNIKERYPNFNDPLEELRQQSKLFGFDKDYKYYTTISNAIASAYNDVSKDFPELIKSVVFAGEDITTYDISLIRDDFVSRLDELSSILDHSEKQLLERIMGDSLFTTSVTNIPSNLVMGRTVEQLGMSRITFNTNVGFLNKIHTKTNPLYTKGAAFWYVAHELGHHIDKAYRASNINHLDWDYYFLGKQLKKIAQTSRGKVDSEEAIAEAFADYYSNGENANRSSKIVINYLKEHI